MTTSKLPIIFPTIHMNGSSAERLLEDTEAAMRAVVNAIDAVCAAAPNARDYYPQGPSAWHSADDAHTARVRKLCDVRDELQAIYLNIHEQADERQRSRQ